MSGCDMDSKLTLEPQAVNSTDADSHVKIRQKKLQGRLCLIKTPSNSSMSLLQEFIHHQPQRNRFPNGTLRNYGFPQGFHRPTPRIGNRQPMQTGPLLQQLPSIRFEKSQVRHTLDAPHSTPPAPCVAIFTPSFQPSVQSFKPRGLPLWGFFPLWSRCWLRIGGIS